MGLWVKEEMEDDLNGLLCAIFLEHELNTINGLRFPAIRYCRLAGRHPLLSGLR
jgi:hypothetical protein